MRYIAARDTDSRLLGLTTLRATGDRSTASTNYDIVRLVWPTGAPPAAPDLYPQLFAAVSGVRCLFTAADAAVRAALVSGATALADATGSVLAFAYLSDEDTAGEIAALAGAGGHAVVGADTRLDVEWTDFDGYVASLPRQRRVQVRRERRRYLDAGLRTRVRHATTALDARTAALQVQVAHKYGVGASVPEVLADYADLAATVDDHVVVFLAERDSRTVGVCVCLRDGATLHIRSVGFDYPLAGNDFVYFNLMFYEPITWGAGNGVSGFRFGTGAYVAKCRRGCALEPLYGVVRWPARVADECRTTLAERERFVRAELGTVR
jgi:predicted N-acyltransferase